MKTETTTQQEQDMENFISEFNATEQTKRVLLALWQTLNDKDPADFIRLHQNCFKDHYLTWNSDMDYNKHKKGYSDLNDTDFITAELDIDIDDIDIAEQIYDTICEMIKEKYIEFTEGLEDIMTWYDPSEWQSIKEEDIKYACNMIEYSEYRKIIIDRDPTIKKDENRDKQLCELLGTEYTPDYENSDYDDFVDNETEFAEDYMTEVCYDYVSGFWYRHLILEMYEEIKERL
jgi:hypothetical protein